MSNPDGFSKTRVLVAGSDGLATRSFLELLSKQKGLSLALTDTDDSKDADWYFSRNVKNVPLYSTGVRRFRGVRIIGGVSRLFSLFGRYRTLEPMDILHIQGMWPETLLLLDVSGLKAKHIICSFWGSDLLRMNNVFKPLVRRWLEKADAITFQNRVTMKSAFQRIWGDTYDDKLRGVLYDVENREIDNLVFKMDGSEAKRCLGVDDSKYTIAIGYNANPNMHHLEVLRQLSKLPLDTLEIIHLIFPFTYPRGNDEYRETIKQFVKDMPCTATYFEGWLREDEVALMRLACDMLVHAQTSDAASASVIEFLKAGASLVNAGWIDYRELRDLGVTYREFSSFEQLPEIIAQQMSDCEALDASMRNREILLARDERALSRDAWLSIYNELGWNG